MNSSTAKDGFFLWSLMAKLKVTQLTALRGHKADVTKYETTCPVTFQQALCLMGMLRESQAFMKKGHLACKDRKRQRTKLAPCFYVRKPS